MKKEIHAYFRGRVQGVGFRFTAIEIARESGIYGWVKNLDDGRVELIAQAEEEALKEFLAKIDRHFSRYIQEVDTEWSEATGKFKDFGVRF